MASKRVIAFCLHEHEVAAVAQHFEADAVWTEAFGVGTMDEAGIAELEDLGILVEVLEDEVGEAATSRGGRLSLDAGPPSPPAPLHPTKDNVFVLTLDGPLLLEPWRRQLEALGVHLLEHRPPRGYTASLASVQVAAVRALPFVRAVEPFVTETYEAVTGATQRAAPRGLGAAPDPRSTWDVRLHRAEDLGEVDQWLTARGVTVVGRGRRKLRIEVLGAAPELEALRQRPEVAEVQPYVAPTLSGEVARRLLGLDADPALGVDLPLRGAGEIVAIADSGLDAGHPDFAGRIKGLIARGRAGDASDLHGHGTHVAGAAVGDGQASGGITRGTAPAAELFFQSIADATGRLAGLPIELGELFGEAYAAGARIHNNSWSAEARSFYTLSAFELDEFVDAHPDLLVVVAAGNSGAADDPFEPGVVRPLSMGSPATAKNALTVGASRSSRTDGAFAGKTFRDYDQRHFAEPPIGDMTVSGDAACLAAFSSRGPAGDVRVKPDVVAPGTDILSTRAAGTPDTSFWGPSGNPRYAFLGGTSMAAPLVAGCAALVREHYRLDHAVEPSAALVKATLVSGTRRLIGEDVFAGHAQTPDYHQGFGAVHMPTTLPNPAEPWLRLGFVDTWKDAASRLASTGDRRRFAFNVGGGAFLRIGLAWTDPPGPALQNTLGLILEGPIDPPKRLGNEGRPNVIDRMDRANNVQIIRLDDPPPGTYMVVVLARNLLRPPQDYALVITGDVVGGPLSAS